MGSGSSVLVEACQICSYGNLQPVLFLGYQPPPTQMRAIGQRIPEQVGYPLQWLFCPKCALVQLGVVVDPKIIFPPEFPYTSGTTRVLRDNFAEMYEECRVILPLEPRDLVVDIGSNDGTLLSNFKKGGHRIQGIEPTQVGNIANQQEIPTLIAYFDKEAALKIKKEQGPATLITATNVFAHVEEIHDVVENILLLLGERGVFISESHYLPGLIEKLQYDTIYHEHLRYYSLSSLRYLLEMHGLEIIHAKRIPTHGESLRAYASRKGVHPVRSSVAEILNYEKKHGATVKNLKEFQARVALSKLQLLALLYDIKKQGHRVYGVGAAARATTLINHVGLDDAILDCVLEVKGSLKIGKCVPGTMIPVREESCLMTDQPEHALLLSWHIAEDLIPKLTQKGYRGGYIVPLPTPRLIQGDGMVS